MHPWRARFERWFTPLARRTPLSPNAITVIALLLNLAAAGCLAAGAAMPDMFLVALPVLTIAGLLDAFDGIVARVQQKQTRFGDFLDHFADRVSDAALLTGWCIGTAIRPPLAYSVIILTMLVGYLGTQIEATWHQRSYEATGRGEYLLAMFVLPLFAWIHLRWFPDLSETWPFSPEEFATGLIALTAVASLRQRLRLAGTLDR